MLGRGAITAVIVRGAAAAVIAIFLAGCSGGQPAGTSQGEPVHFRSADERTATLLDRDGVVVRAGCPHYGTDTGGPYLSLTARTRTDDADARVAFDSNAGSHFGSHRFAIADFDRSDGAWDLLGAEPSRVRGRFIYRSAAGERVELSFDGSGGRVDGRCRLDGKVRAESGTEPLRVVSAPPQGRWVPNPVGLAPGTGELDRCRPGPMGGGFDVWIKDIPCRQARKWLRPLIPTYGALPVAKGEGIGRLLGGWECWSRLEARYGPIHNVCVRGEQLIMFYFG